MRRGIQTPSLSGEISRPCQNRLASRASRSKTRNLLSPQHMGLATVWPSTGQLATLSPSPSLCYPSQNFLLHPSSLRLSPSVVSPPDGNSARLNFQTFGTGHQEDEQSHVNQASGSPMDYSMRDQPGKPFTGRGLTHSHGRKATTSIGNKHVT